MRSIVRYAALRELSGWTTRTIGSSKAASALSVEAGAPEGLRKDLRSKGTRSMSIEVDIDRVTPDIKPSPGRGVVDRRRYPKNLAPSGISEP